MHNSTEKHDSTGRSNTMLAEVPAGLNDLACVIFERNVEKGFYEKPKNIGEMLCLIHSEVSEALEADRKDNYADKHFIQEMEAEGYTWKDSETSFKSAFEKDVKNTFEDELADIMIRAMDLAAFKGIDLEFHIRQKMEYNLLRQKYHGKKY
jgi:NTP pyrophosphatase (non-canonical NTP hydrolase)